MHGKKAVLILGSLAICFLCISSATAVPQVEGSKVISSLQQSQRVQTMRELIQSWKTQVNQRSKTQRAIQGKTQQGFLQVMLSLLLKLMINLLSLGKGITIGLLNLTVVLLKLTITLLVGTQKILTVAATATIYLGIKATIGALKFFKAATPIAARIASVFASVITPLIGALVGLVVFAISAGAAAAIVLALPLLLVLLLQSLTGESIIPDGAEE
jgi:hypothetical protein